MIRMFITGAEVEVGYVRALAVFQPLRLVPTSGLHLGDDSPWQPLAHLFSTTSADRPSWCSIASAPLGAIWPPMGCSIFAAMWSPKRRNIAIVLGGNSAAKDVEGLARYDAVIAVDDTTANLLNQHDIRARVVPPDAAELCLLLQTIEETWTPETIPSSLCSMT